MIAIVDNYDSFTYNLVHYLEDISNTRPLVCMNDQINWKALDECSHIVLSPGPGLPKTSGDLMQVIGTYHQRKKILGVCLGMQAIAEYFGGNLINLDEVRHGVQNSIHISTNSLLYKDLPSTIEVGRYHSWGVDEQSLPDELVVTSRDEWGTPMSIEHRSFQVYAVQYHPESIMTEHGKTILTNWIRI